MSITSRWDPGDPVLFRSVRYGRVGYLRSLTVVLDSDDLIALYIGPGYPCKRLSGARGGPGARQLLDPERDEGHEDWLWKDTRVLILYHPGEAHSVQLFRPSDRDDLLCWYIDLHEPLRRTPLGFDSRDQVLDIVVDADRSSWRWKDDDELEWAVAHGRVTPHQVAILRAEGERAIRKLVPDLSDRYVEWLAWSPDERWPIPTIPRGWDRVS